MNKQASIKRVAKLHLARVYREAAVKKDLVEIVKKPLDKYIHDQFKESVEGAFSKEALHGWGVVGKKLGPAKVLKSKGSDFDQKDPMQRLVSLAIQGKSAKDKVEMVGRFTKAYSERNTGNMASALGVGEDIVVLTLLYYTQNKTARRLSMSETALRRAPKTTEWALATWPKKTLDFLATITGGRQLEWLIKLAPEGQVLAKPVKWAYWSALVKSSWTILDLAIKWIPVVGDWLIAFFRTKGAWGELGIMAVKTADFILYLFNPYAPNFYLGLILAGFLFTVYWGTDFWAYFDSRMSLMEKVLTNLKALWMVIRGMLTGVISVGRSVVEDIKEYITENKPLLKRIFGEKEVNKTAALLA